MSSKLRDTPVKVTADGKRIFAYNDKGVPICYATLTGGRGRCQSRFTMTNGRCKKHGGKAPSGIMHWNAQHLRSAGNLPKHLQGDMNRALNDPDQLNLNHEIAMTDVHIAKLKEALDTGLDNAAWKRMHTLADRLEHSLVHDPEESESLCLKLIETIRQGSGERTVWKEYHEIEDARRRLVATAHTREKDLRTLLKADQAIALVTGCAAGCREQVSRLFNEIEARYSLTDKQLKQEVPRLDPSLRNDFLSQVAISLGNLIGSTRTDPGEPNPYTVRPEANPNKSSSRKAREAEDLEADYIDG